MLNIKDYKEIIIYYNVYYFNFYDNEPWNTYRQELKPKTITFDTEEIVFVEDAYFYDYLLQIEELGNYRIERRVIFHSDRYYESLKESLWDAYNSNSLKEYAKKYAEMDFLQLYRTVKTTTGIENTFCKIAYKIRLDYITEKTFCKDNFLIDEIVREYQELSKF